MSDSIKVRLDSLLEFQQHNITAGKALTRFDRLFHIDLLAIVCLNRSTQLLVAFAYLIQNRNFVSAAPLLRLQLDNCLRFYAANTAPDSAAFVTSVLAGTPVKKLRDASGELMTDAYLVEQLSTKLPWVESVYRETSGYVHLSEKHFFNAFDVPAESERFVGKISAVDSYVPEDVYFEAVDGFAASTELLLVLVSAVLDSKRSYFDAEKSGNSRE